MLRRVALVRLALVRLAAFRLVAFKLASGRSASIKVMLDKYILLRSAPLRSAPVSSMMGDLTQHRLAGGSMDIRSASSKNLMTAVLRLGSKLSSTVIVRARISVRTLSR